MTAKKEKVPPTFCTSCGAVMPVRAVEIFKGYCHACTASAAELNQRVLNRTLILTRLEPMVRETFAKNNDGEEHPASSFHYDGPKDCSDWTVENVEAVLLMLSQRPAGYAPVKRCASKDCGWYTVLPVLPLEPLRFDAVPQTAGQAYVAQLLDLAQKGQEARALSEVAVAVLEGAAATISRLLNVEVRLEEAPPPSPKPVSREYDAWAGAHPIAGSDEWHLVRATSEALCRELVWRLAQKKLPDACRDAVAEAFATDGTLRLMGFDKKKAGT